MPLSIDLAHKLCRRLAAVRKDGTLPYLRPDGKSQVTVEFTTASPRAGYRRHLDAARPDVDHAKIEMDMIDRVIKYVVPNGYLDAATKIYVNPTGRFVVGGPAGDTGLDRAQDHRGHLRRRRPARWRLLLGQGSDEGRPLSVIHDALRRQEPGRSRRGGPRGDPGQLRHRRGPPCERRRRNVRHRQDQRRAHRALVHDNFDLRPAAIIRDLNLRRPIYKATAAYGHFGRTDIDAPWEKLDKVAVLKKAAGLA